MIMSIIRRSGDPKVVVETQRYHSSVRFDVYDVGYNHQYLGVDQYMD